MMIKHGADVIVSLSPLFLNAEDKNLNLVEYAYAYSPKAIPELLKSENFDPAKVQNLEPALVQIGSKTAVWLGHDAALRRATKPLLEAGVKMDKYLAPDANKSISMETQDFLATQIHNVHPENEAVRAFNFRKNKSRKSTRKGMKARRAVYKAVIKDRKEATRRLFGHTPEEMREIAYFVSMLLGKHTTVYDYYKEQAKQKVLDFHKRTGFITAVGKSSRQREQ